MAVSFFLFFPILIMLFLAGIALLVLFIRLLKDNPKLATILALVPVILLTLIFVLRFFRVPATAVTVFPKQIILLIVVIPLLILFIMLCIKKPKVAAILALIPVACFVFIFLINVFIISQKSHRVSEIGNPQMRPNGPGAQTSIRQWGDNPGIQEFTTYPNSSNQSAIQIQSVDNIVLPPGAVRYSSNESPIWSEAIEEEFEADIYSTEISALRALAPRVVKQIPYIMGELESPEMIVIYPGSLELEDVEQFREVLEKLTPEMNNRIEIGQIDTKEKEVGIRFSRSRNNPFVNNRGFSPSTRGMPPIRGMSARGMDFVTNGDGGTINASIFSGQRQRNISIRYSNKSWVENFSDFANRIPSKRYLLARSSESCLSLAEADQQAMNDACRQIEPMFANTSLTPVKLNSQNILETDLIVDKFVQSFEGSAGKIWRQALLLDVSPDKMNRLADNIAGISRREKQLWARTILSIAGLFVIIIIVYAFLNAATKGYYTWSLRVVGVVLAIILLLIVLNFA